MSSSNALFPYANTGWAAYSLSARIDGPGQVHAPAPHANLPPEIWAEDFRALVRET